MFSLGIKERHTKLDWGLILAVGALMLLGWPLSIARPWPMNPPPSRRGIASGFHASHLGRGRPEWSRPDLPGGLPYPRAVSLVAYWATILLLVIVLIPGIGATHGWGARRWLDTGIFQVQPSEFAKLSFILAMANFLSRPQDELRSWECILEGPGHDGRAFCAHYEGTRPGIGVDFIANGAGK